MVPTASKLETLVNGLASLCKIVFFLNGSSTVTYVASMSRCLMSFLSSSYILFVTLLFSFDFPHIGYCLKIEGEFKVFSDVSFSLVFLFEFDVSCI